MKKLLPVLIIFFGFLFSAFVLFVPLQAVHAQSANNVTPSPADSRQTLPAGNWVEDAEVTFTGKMANRADDFINFTLNNYSWSFVEQGKTNPLESFWVMIRNIIYAMFVLVVLVTGFVLVATRGKSLTIKKFIPRFVLIIILVTFSYALIQILYQIGDIIQLMFLNKRYFLNAPTDQLIQSTDLLSLGFDYKEFVGLRKTGVEFDESAFVSLLLIKLTSVTYFVMGGLLIVRKIILWFFITVSPIFPLLLLYAPVRNTAKIWLGEFMRWLLYAPLFAVLLAGLVAMWSSNVGIPLDFNNIPQLIKNEQPIYPTAINIVLAGPGHAPTIDDSVNLPQTFAQYVIALLMLWAVIILPFILLKIFLDYFHAYSFSENPWVKQVIASSSTLLGRNNPPPSPAGPYSPSPSGSTGLARALPFANKSYVSDAVSATNNMSLKRETTIPTSTQNLSYTKFSSPTRVTTQALSNTEVLKLADLFVPTLRDVARYETSTITNNVSSNKEVAHFTQTLEQLANPASITTNTERERFAMLKQQLVAEQQKGNPIAAAVLSASNISTVTTTSAMGGISNITNVDNTVLQQQQMQQMKNVLTQIAHPETVTSSQKQAQFTEIKQEIAKAQVAGDPLATTIVSTVNSMQTSNSQTTIEQLKETLLTEAQKGNKLAATVLAEAGIDPEKEKQRKEKQSKVSTTAQFPVINRVQAVSLDDYEQVKKMWVENYQKLEPPKGKDGTVTTRKQWVESDINKISNVIALLTAPEPKAQKQGMDMVSNILPFLLIGGFSKNEVIAYMKSKLEAAKVVASDLKQKDEEESTMLDAEHKKKEEQNVMHMEQEAQTFPNPSINGDPNNGNKNNNG